MNGDTHRDMLDLFNRIGTIFPENNILPHGQSVNLREIFRNERNCINCIHINACWPIPDNINMPSTFRLRSGWDMNRFSMHIKGVMGQVCDNFVVAQLTRQPEKDSTWNSEENI